MTKLKRSTQLTIFSTGLIVASTLLLYVMIVSDAGFQYVRSHHFLLLIFTAIAAYVVSSMIIDAVLNPIRLMISKVREIGDMNFKKPLVITEEDDELREYAFQFNHMALKLNQYIERQKRFVSDASHELSTPITIINGHADMLLRHGKNDDMLLEKGLSTIKHEILQMNHLVENLLTLARSDGGSESYTLQPVNIGKLLQESIDEIKPTAPNFTFTLQATDIQANCDEYAIRRVMRIILTNAIKYAENGKKVDISATQSHELVEITVTDNGIGIPKPHLTRVFERFHRVDASRSKKTGSSGLGLAIAKEIITAHKGDIIALSPVAKNQGTSIKFRISS